MKYDKIQPSAVVLLAPFGYVPHFMGNQPPNGVEVLVLIGLDNLHTKSGLYPFDGRVAAHAVTAIGQPENIPLVFGNVELIFDFANDLLQDILDGDEALQRGQTRR